MVLPLYAALERMDWTLVEAAQDLGDSAFRAFRRVTLPLVLPGVIAGCLLVFIPLTGEFLIPSILGGEKIFYVGNLIAQQFGEARDWPFGAAIAMVVIARHDRWRCSSTRGCSGGRSSSVARRLLGLHALLVYAFLYAPDPRRRRARLQRRPQRPLLGGLLDEWFGAALRNPDIRDSLQTSLIVAALERVLACVLGTLLALALSRMRAWIRVPDRRARVHDARHAGDRLRDRRADLLRRGRRARRGRARRSACGRSSPPTSSSTRRWSR